MLDPIFITTVHHGGIGPKDPSLLRALFRPESREALATISVSLYLAVVGVSHKY
jgi:hypothetical protein